MGFFEVDYSNASEQITPGSYEAYISDFQITIARSGNTQVSLFYTIRTDVPQPFQGATINYDRFVVTPAAKWRFDSLAKAVGIPDGTKFQDEKAWAMAMVNRDLIVRVEMGEPNAKGNSYPEPKAYASTQHPSQGRPAPQLKHAYEQQQQNQRQDDVWSAANRVVQNGSQQQGYGQQAAYGQPVQGQSNYQTPPSQGQQAPAQSFQQSSLPGTDPMAADQRSFANGGFDGTSINISDDDLPF